MMWKQFKYTWCDARAHLSQCSWWCSIFIFYFVVYWTRSESLRTRTRRITTITKYTSHMQSIRIIIYCIHKKKKKINKIKHMHCDNFILNAILINLGFFHLWWWLLSYIFYDYFIIIDGSSSRRIHEYNIILRSSLNGAAGQTPLLPYQILTSAHLYASWFMYMIYKK